MYEENIKLCHDKTAQSRVFYLVKYHLQKFARCPFRF